MRIQETIVVIVVLCIVLFSLILNFGTSYDTTYVRSTVNITNAGPIIGVISIYPASPINLSEGDYLRVQCNITVTDYNGYSDIKHVNATFYMPGNVSFNAAKDNNSMYRNSTCTINESISAQSAVFSCTFNVMYYANNGTWNCTVLVRDDSGLESNKSQDTTIDSLYSINVTDLIDYGNLSVFETSLAQEVNITNLGNRDLNLTIYGYGGDDFANGQGIALSCSIGDNITIDNERYALNATNWTAMVNLTSAAVLLRNLTVVQQTNDAAYVINSTYWRLYVPPNPYGVCNGTVVFEAIAP